MDQQNQQYNIGGINYTADDIVNKGIVELMGLMDLPEEKKDKIRQAAQDTIQGRALARVFDNLDENEQQKFKQLLEQSDDTKIEEYLKTKNIDMGKITIEETLLYKLQMVNTAKAARS